jgi:hypothetical protein
MGLGLCQFTFIPFGLRNALENFKKLIEFVLRGITYEACLVYLDDVVVVSWTFQEQTNDQNICQRFWGAYLD